MRTNRRGISDVLTSIILVMATVSLSSVFMFWALSYLGQSQSSIGLGISQGNAKVQEQVSIDGVFFTGTNQVNVYVRNFGDLPLKVDHVYVNGILYTVTAVTISGRSEQSIAVTLTSNWTSGTTYTVRVATTRGNIFEQGFTAP